MVMGINSQTIITEPVLNKTIVSVTSTIAPNSFYAGQSVNNASGIFDFYFGIPKEQKIKISVIDFLGKEIMVVLNDRFDAGFYKAEFSGALLKSGVYLFKIETVEYTEIKKFTVII